MNKWVKGIILAYLSLLFFGSFLAIGLLWTGVIQTVFPIIIKIEIFLYYFFAGAIGASLRHLYMFCSHYMNDDFDNPREWIMYIFYPIFATGTAIIAVSLIQSGILIFEFASTRDAPFGQISIAFFVGFGFNRFLDKLNSVSKTIFKANKPEANKKEPITEGTNKPE
ncbi:hypothetical protein [Litchfieldia salsa]|nr:hypothetical protein [Litchfieldia salsa]